MPILWRYLLSHFLKVFFLCVATFIAILLTLRLGEIAYFATLGPQLLRVIWFTLQQIPYVLPIAFPVSALISSALLVQGLSQSKELTALRASGFAIKDILAPVLATALFLSATNFYVVSELSTVSHLNAGQLKNQLRSVNPLLLLNNRLLMHMKGLYFDTLGSSHVGEYAEDIVLLAPTNHSKRLTLMVAKRLDVSPDVIAQNRATIITGQPAKNDQIDSEHIIIENMETSSTTIQDFSQLFEKKIWAINNDHLVLPLLLARKDEADRTVQESMKKGASKDDIKAAKQTLSRTKTEIVRRLSVAGSVFSFTLLGLAFGISISRNRTSRGIIQIILLASVYLVSFFIAKSFDHAFLSAALLYLAPLALICGASLLTLRKIAHGVE